MQPCHIPQVVRIERESHPEPWSEGAFLEELTLPQSTSLVAGYPTPPAGRLHEEGPCLSPLSTVPPSPIREVVGYVCVWIVAHELQVLNVTVAAPWRGRSIGRRLLAYVLNLGRERGATLACLEVRKHNTAARRLYRGAGFLTVGERPGYYGPGQESALLMQMDLKEDAGE